MAIVCSCRRVVVLSCGRAVVWSVYAPSRPFTLGQSFPRVVTEPLR